MAAVASSEIAAVITTRRSCAVAVISSASPVLCRSRLHVGCMTPLETFYHIRQRRLRASRVRPDGICNHDEFGARGGKQLRLVDGLRIADAGRLKHLCP